MEKISKILIGVTSAILFCPYSLAQNDQAAGAEAFTMLADELAQVKTDAGNDFIWLNDRYCHPVNDPDGLVRATQNAMWSSMRIPPTKVFDNLYYVGHAQLGAWLLETSEGYILFDALNTPDEAIEYIETGMAELGIDPNTVRNLVIMQGHGDHWGGGKYLQDKYGMSVTLGANDWELLENVVPTEPRGAPPVRDLSIEGDGEIRLGDTTVRIISTPGHTPGTMSALIRVIDGDNEHLAAFWGGTGLPNNETSLRQYQQSLRRFKSEAETAGADVLISNHPYLDSTLNALPLLGWRKAGDVHPFVLGEDSVSRYYQILDLCVSAELARPE